MGQDINVDFGLLGQPHNFVGDYVNAFKVGQELGKQTAIKNANALFATDPQAGAQAASAIDPLYGAQLSKITADNQTAQSSSDEATALASGDRQGALTGAAGVGPEEVMKVQQAYAAADDKTKAALKENNEALGSIALGFLGDPAHNVAPVPLEQRLPIAQHILQQRGLDPNLAKPEDMTDAALRAHVQSVQTIEQIYKQQDDAAKQAETHRHNLATEGKPQYVETKNADGTTTQTLVNGQAAQAGAGAPSAPIPTGPVADAVMAAAQKYGVDPQLALSIANAESGMVPGKTSHKGAQGVMQLMPATAHDLGVDPTDTAQNIDGGVRYIKQLSDKYHGDPTLIAAAYNAGPGAVDHHGGVPPYAETQAYVKKVVPGSYQVASNGPTPSPPSGQGGGVQAPASGGPPAVIGGAGQSAGMTTGDVTKSGSAYLASMDPTRAAQIKALDDGRMPLPTGFALKSPYWQSMLADAAKYDPNFDAVNYPARVKTRTDFTSGKSAQNLTALNTALGHMDTLDRSIDGLNNNPIPVVNAFAHVAGPAVGNQDTATALGRFNAAKTAVAAELTRVFRGGQGAEADVKGWQAQLDDAKSPQALHAVVRQMAALLASRVNALGDQYNQGMGTTRDGLSLLHPAAAMTLARLGGEDGHEAAAKAAFYQAREGKMAPAEIDAGWQKYQAQNFGTGAKGAQPGASSPTVRHYNPQTGRLE